jgi:hypothetical protein
LPPNSDRTALIALARAAAAQHSLNPALICAIVEQESAWDPHAIRYEPAFRTRYVAPLGLPPTGEVARSISWGLMQVMGQVAREHGFTAKSLAALCDPATSCYAAQIANAWLPRDTVLLALSFPRFTHSKPQSTCGTGVIFSQPPVGGRLCYSLTSRSTK